MVAGEKRNASQYSASIGGLGQSVQFWGGGNGADSTADGFSTFLVP